MEAKMNDGFTSLSRTNTAASILQRTKQREHLSTVSSGTRVTGILKVIAIATVVGVVVGAAVGLIVYFANNDDDGDKVYGSWGAWRDWVSCDVTCGNGLQTRTRDCQKTAATDLDCTGDNSGQQACSMMTCPATWSSWGAWGACDVTCGEGVYFRYRECVSPSEASGQCTGDSREVAACVVTNCPVYGSWTAWSGWGSCQVSCGGGQQTRTRTCNTTAASDLNCVGVASMSQGCNDWACPDCTRSCDTGVLNSACDTCMCSNSNVSVRTLTTGNKPLMDVTAYALSAPTTLLATSDAGGSLVLSDACVGMECIFVKEGFMDTYANMTAASITVNLQQTEYPRLVTSPVSKYRLSGGGAAFCCVAVATPNITYYEWFKDGAVLDDSLYPVQTELTLLSLTNTDSGTYRCRANSAIGAVFSQEVTLLVKATSEIFCQNSLQDMVVSLPSDCIQNETNTASYNTRTCATDPCRNEISSTEAICSDTTYSCCSPATYTNAIVQCSGYSLTVQVVQSCGCATCALSQFTVSGIAFGVASNAPLNNGQVYLNGELETTTSSNGSFSMTIAASPDTQTLTLKFTDKANNDFHEMVKSVTIPAASTENVYLSVKMVEKPEPVVLQSDVENTLFGGGSNSTNSSAAVAEIVIPPDAFYYDNGTKFSGSVSSVLTYILPTDLEAYDSVPGTFQFVNSEGEVSQLDTMGVFSLQFYDDSNQELSVSEPIDVTMTGSQDGVDPDTGESMQLWGLSESTGMWELLPFVQAKRRRRRNSNIVIGQINTGNFYWRNCDIFWGARKCYFNPKAYTDTTFSSEIETSVLRLTYLYTRPSWWGRTSARWTTETYMYRGTACRYIYCSDSTSYLQLERSVSGVSTLLLPRAPADSSTYTLTDSGSAVSIVMGTSNNNFYSSRSQCVLASTTSAKLYFHQLVDEENLFTFNWFQNGIPDSVDPVDYEEYEYKSWCRNRGESNAEQHQTQACALKIRVLSTSLTSLAGIQILGSSSMGNASSNYSGYVVGVRRVLTDTNGYACISYRCITDIEGIIDETQVSVSAALSDGNVTCGVVAQNKNLASASQQIGAESFELIVDDDGQDIAGLYKHYHGKFNKEDRDCRDLAIRARDTCYRGLQNAVTFICGIIPN